jgi:hypothetical protein
VVVTMQRDSQEAFDQVLVRATSAVLTEALRQGAVLSTAGKASYWKVAEVLQVQSLPDNQRLHIFRSGFTLHGG